MPILSSFHGWDVTLLYGYLYRISTCFSALGNTNRAYYDAGRCLSIDKKCIAGYHRKAGCFVDAMRYDWAIKTMQEALRIDAGLGYIFRCVYDLP